MGKILSASSPVFASMFQSDFVDSLTRRREDRKHRTVMQNYEDVEDKIYD